MPKGNRTNHPTRLITKRSLKWFSVHVDEYTFDLIIQAIEQGQSKSKVEAVNRGLCLLLGIDYKTDDQILTEKEQEYIRKMAELSHTKTLDERAAELRRELADIEGKLQGQSTQPDSEVMALLVKTQEVADAKRKEMGSHPRPVK